jgi:hypothetical protein
MKFEEVLPALRAGKKIKIENIPGKYHKDISRGCELSIDLILSGDFEIVKEKVKKTVWVNVFHGGYKLISDGVFESEEEAVSSARLCCVKWFGAHSITVEVEE